MSKEIDLERVSDLYARAKELAPLAKSARRQLPPDDFRCLASRELTEVFVELVDEHGVLVGQIAREMGMAHNSVKARILSAQES